jgi:hypothetical protein
LGTFLLTFRSIALQVGFILNQSDIFFLELVLNRFGFLLMYRFISSEVSFPSKWVLRQQPFQSKAWLSSNVKRLWFVILPVQLIRHNKPYFS